MLIDSMHHWMSSPDGAALPPLQTGWMIARQPPSFAAGSRRYLQIATGQFVPASAATFFTDRGEAETYAEDAATLSQFVVSVVPATTSKGAK